MCECVYTCIDMYLHAELMHVYIYMHFARMYVRGYQSVLYVSVYVRGCACVRASLGDQD